MIGHRRERRDDRRRPALQSDTLCQQGGGSPVGFREHNIERHRRRSRRRQLPNQRRNIGTRPRPLPQPPDRLIVYVDNPNACILERTRCRPLIPVEQQKTQPIGPGKPGDLQRKHAQQCRQPDQDRAALVGQMVKHPPYRPSPHPAAP